MFLSGYGNYGVSGRIHSHDSIAFRRGPGSYERQWEVYRILSGPAGCQVGVPPCPLPVPDRRRSSNSMHQTGSPSR
jgi:hypothetical protein